MALPRVMLMLAAFCSALVITRAIAPNGNCELLFAGQPLLSSDWDGFCNVSAYAGNLKDTTLPGVAFAVFTSENVASFTYESSSSYVDVLLDTDANTLSLVVTDRFPHYEEDMISASQPSTIGIGITFSCSDGNTQNFRFMITVEDVNTHAPEFEQSNFECALPMPFPPDTDLSCIMGEINVQDIDFSNEAVTIQFDEKGDQLLRAAVTYEGNRIYAVHLYCKTTCDFENTRNFSMTAVDSGTPALASAPAILTISKYQGRSHRFSRRGL